jgi:hypothetical protein
MTATLSPSAAAGSEGAAIPRVAALSGPVVRIPLTQGYVAIAHLNLPQVLA